MKDADDKGLDLYVLEKIALVRRIEVKEKLHREGLLVKSGLLRGLIKYNT